MLRHFGTIHSVDSLDLAQRLGRIAAEEGLSPAVFLQVKLRPDPAKGASIQKPSGSSGRSWPPWCRCGPWV